MSDPQSTEELQDQQTTQPESVQVDGADTIAVNESKEQHSLPEESAESEQTEPSVSQVDLQLAEAAYKRFQEIVQENERLKQKNLELTEANQQLDKKLTETEQRFSELLGTLSEFNRNRTSTYVSGSRPQNHLLVHDFIQLKDQDFQFVSTLIFHWISEHRTDMKLDRKQTIAEIKSTLSECILMPALSLIEVEQDRAIATLSDSVRAVFSNQDDFSSMPEELDQALKSLIQKGLGLAEKIALADPPGDLWIAPAGTRFDAEQHQPLLGYQPLGDIHFTVYPGYRAGNRIFEKACVLTEKDA